MAQMLLLECVSLFQSNKKKKRELVYGVIGQCGQGYQRELSRVSVDVMKGWVE